MADDAPSLRYRVNEPAVIHQAIDNELVIINLDRGLYYSLDSTGARIWAELAAGQPATTVIERMERDVVAHDGEVAAAVDGLVERLCSEELLVPKGDAPAASRNGVGHDSDGGFQASDDASQVPVTFVAPVLRKYDDLQDLLLLDPIHAVDESGWPDRRDDG
jgi:hypothetical protein